MGRISLFLDSGAFSAYTQKKAIDIDAYIEFIKANTDRILVAASLDVIGDPVATLRNYCYMRERLVECPVPLLPTVHRGSGRSWITQYVEAGATYIGLGGMAKCTAAERVAFLDPVFAQYPDPEKIGFHGFGIGRDHMLPYPWKSVDSTTVSTAARQGCLYTPYQKDVVSLVPGATHYTSIAGMPVKLLTVQMWVASLGGDWEACQMGGTAGDTARAAVMIKYFELLRSVTPPWYNTGRRLLL